MGKKRNINKVSMKFLKTFIFEMLNSKANFKNTKISILKNKIKETFDEKYRSNMFLND